MGMDNYDDSNSLQYIFEQDRKNITEQIPPRCMTCDQLHSTPIFLIIDSYLLMKLIRGYTIGIVCKIICRLLYLTPT